MESDHVGKGLSIASHTVLELVHGLNNTGHEIYVKSFYTGVDLFLERHDIGALKVGALSVVKPTVCKGRCCKERNVFAWLLSIFVLLVSCSMFLNVQCWLNSYVLESNVATY